MCVSELIKSCSGNKIVRGKVSPGHAIRLYSNVTNGPNSLTVMLQGIPVLLTQEVLCMVSYLPFLPL